MANSAWKKGGPSPNPNGRPKTDVLLRGLFREHTEEARDKLVLLMRGKWEELGLDGPVRQDIVLKACTEILDRGIGKPKPAPEGGDPLEGKGESETIEAVDQALRSKGLRVVPVDE